MVLGLYGKHPAKGDFLEAGLPPALQRILEGWLDSVLAEVRETLGPEWQAAWDRAPALCFWLGETIWGGVVAGVLAPSRDRVGRRFPLLLLAAGADAPAPPIQDPSGWHGRAAAFLRNSLAAQDFAGAAALLDAAPQPVPVDHPEQPGSFWAVRPGADVATLWADVAATDVRHAAASRSYWWVAGEDAASIAPETPPDPAVDPMHLLAPRPALWSQVWAGAGLPSGAVLAWLLRGHSSDE